MDDTIATAAEAAENHAMPRVHEVHTDPDKCAPKTENLPDSVRSSAKSKSAAQWAYERLIIYIKNFEEQLDAQHEIAMGFTGGDAGVIRIEGMGFFDPDIVTFYGTDPTGAKTQLIQHVSQLNVMLRALPKQVDQAEPNRIGFRLASDLDKSDQDAGEA